MEPRPDTWGSFRKRNEMQTFSFSFSSWKMLQADRERTRSQHTAKGHNWVIPVSKGHQVLLQRKVLGICLNKDMARL